MKLNVQAQRSSADGPSNKMYENTDYKVEEMPDQKLEEKCAKLRKANASSISGELAKFERTGLKYYYIEEKKFANWFYAADKCREMGANLVSLQSMEELKAVSEKLNKYNYWLDINDLGKEGVYRSQYSGREPGILHWHSREPNNNKGNEHCIALKKENQCLQ